MTHALPDLDARIEAAARLLDPITFDRPLTGHATGECVQCDFTRQDCRDTALSMLQSAFPELFTDPPTAWLAPWETTGKMNDIGDDILDFGGSIDAAYAAMRDAHLSKEDE